MNLILGVHAHQPVGNWEGVFEWAFDRCYGPFLEVLSRFRGVKVAFHLSGPLLEWLLSNRPGFVERLGEMVREGRAEILGGGMYEPILAVIPERDALGQLEMMSSLLERTFGVRPRGAWLAERVWEPHLPKILAEAGLDYVFLDDRHFVCAGLEEPELVGHFLTEHDGRRLFVFPISQRLRYIIPFRDLKLLVEHLGRLDGAGIVFDDYEKFGLWPETYEWVYQKGWLERFFELLSRGSIRSFLPSEWIALNPPRGLVYLPTCSYVEMEEWSLEPRRAILFRGLVDEVREKGEELIPLVRGGHWRNFLRKFTEANRLHKRMLWASALVDDMPEGEDKVKAKAEIYKSQCNDAYWHGIFGGFYLPHLRGALLGHLTKAESIALGNRSLAWAFDLDADGMDEILVVTPKVGFTLAPSKGGTLVELTDRSSGFSWSNVITRRKEHYHLMAEMGGGAPSTSDEGGIATIHERAFRLEDVELEEDLRPRLFLSEVLENQDGSQVRMEDVRMASSFLDEFAFQMFPVERGPLLDLGFSHKSVSLVDMSLIIKYHFVEALRAPLRATLSFSLGVSSKDSLVLRAGGVPVVPRADGLEVADGRFEVWDRARGCGLGFSFSEPFVVRTKGLETLSQSERGYERVYQGEELSFEVKVRGDLVCRVDLLARSSGGEGAE